MAQAKAHTDRDAVRCDEGIVARTTQSLLHRGFHRLGKWIASKPKTAIGIGFAIIMSGMPATFILPGEAHLLWVKMAAGFEPFSLESTGPFVDRQTSNGIHDHFFVPTHGRNAMIVISPRDPVSMPVFSAEFMKAALALVTSIYETDVLSGAGSTYNFTDLCAPTGLSALDEPLSTYKDCASAGSDLFSAIDWTNASIPVAGRGETLYGSGAHDYAEPLANLATMLSTVGVNSSGFFRAQVGMPEEDERSFHFWQPRSVTIPFTLRDDRHLPSAAPGDPAGAWIKALQASVVNREYVNSDLLHVSFMSDQSIADEFQTMLNTFIPFLCLVFFVMGAYSEFFLFSQTRTKRGEATQMLLVIQGLVIAGAAGFSGCGWILYIGLEDIVIMCCMAIFLVMAVGVDCTFIFVSAMHGAGETLSVEEATGHMLAEAATAITLTTSSSPAMKCASRALVCSIGCTAHLRSSCRQHPPSCCHHRRWLQFDGRQRPRPRRHHRRQHCCLPLRHPRPLPIAHATHIAQKPRRVGGVGARRVPRACTRRRRRLGAGTPPSRARPWRPHHECCHQPGCANNWCTRRSAGAASLATSPAAPTLSAAASILTAATHALPVLASFLAIIAFSNLCDVMVMNGAFAAGRFFLFVLSLCDILMRRLAGSFRRKKMP